MEYTVLLVVEVLSALGLIGLVLLQQGKGADMGASFGAGASQTIFGSGGSGNFMTRMTAIFATVFFAACLGLGYFATQYSRTDPESLDFSNPSEQSTTGDLPPAQLVAPPVEQAASDGALPPMPVESATMPAAASGEAAKDAETDEISTPAPNEESITDGVDQTEPADPVNETVQP